MIHPVKSAPSCIVPHLIQVKGIFFFIFFSALVISTIHLKTLANMITDVWWSYFQ